MMAALSGSNLVHDVGFIEGGMTSSFDQLVFTNEMIGKCARLLGGIRVDEESLAVGVTRDVGPGGTFLTHKHTSAHCRTAWAPGAGGSAEPRQLGEGRVPRDARSGERQGPGAPRGSPADAASPTTSTRRLARLLWQR